MKTARPPKKRPAKKKKAKKVAKKRPAKTPERIDNWRDARRAGKIWVTAKINGGDVKLGGQGIGTMSSKGPMSPVRGLILWMVIMGSSLEDIQAHLKEEGYEE